MRRTRMLASVCLVALVAGCSASLGEETSALAPQPAPAGVDGGRGAVAAEMGAADTAGAAPPGGAASAAQRDSRPVPASDAATIAPGSGSPTGPHTGQPVSVSQRQVVRDATVELQVDDIARAADRARSIGPRFGGFVATEDSAADVVTLTLRVASSDLDAALAALAELGEVTSRRLSTQDVTEETVDLAARIASQRASVERVRALLDRATTIGEVVQVESELTWRQAELESLQQRAAALADQVALSTVQVRLQGPEAAQAAAAAGGFGAGLAAGWDALRATGRVVLRVLGAVLPFAVVLVLPTGVALLWYRRRRAAAAHRVTAAADA